MIVQDPLTSNERKLQHRNPLLMPRTWEEEEERHNSGTAKLAQSHKPLDRYTVSSFVASLLTFLTEKIRC